MTELETLKQWIEESSNIVFFGGAGVSTESGIPDFRSQDGLYNQEYDYPPETIISHSFFVSNPKEFYRFYKNKMICTQAKPNKAHLALAKPRASVERSSRRTSTGCTRWPAAGRCWSFMVPSTGIIVPDAENFMAWMQ